MSGSQPSSAILAWAKGQSVWRQDALRRTLTKSFIQTDEDECLELLNAEHGLAQTKIKPQALEANHLPIRSATATSLKLIALDDIANVNRLAKDAALSLGPDGLTLIYGDNGSGKSGFIRILKKACRARDHESILPDIYATKKANSPASARFTVQEATKQTPVVWLDDGKSSSDLLGRLAIFDSKCAAVHVDSENRLEIVPYSLDCFEKLAQVCDRLRARLKAECDALDANLAGPLPQPPQGTTAEQLIANLSEKSAEELTAASEWKEADDKRLIELSGMLKDPLAEAQRYERLASSLQQYTDGLEQASIALADEKIKKIASLRKSAQELREQSNTSAAAAFADESLKGVGEEPWRTMFDTAKAYSEQHAFPGEAFPVMRDGAQCVLCQQELDERARDRFDRFASFVRGAMNNKATQAETVRDAALLAIGPATLPITDLTTEVRDALVNRAKALSESCVGYRNALLKRRNAVLANDDTSQALPQCPVSKLREEIVSFNAAAKQARELANADTSNAEALRSEHAELTGRKIIHDNEAELLRRIDIHERIGKLQKAMKACATKDISDHGSKLLKAHVTEALASSLADEQKLLGIDSIRISLSDRTEKAVIQHRLKLDGATLSADTSAVLSEGEHRAVALTAFLAELRMYPAKDAVIIDDPVSSLDHVRRGRVAERLVSEAKDRQVIVFTHDMVFLSEVRYYAAKFQVPLRVLGIRRGPNGFGSLDPDGEPWLAKNLKGRNHWLTQQLTKLKKLYAIADEDYEVQLRFFYDRLRESWEKFIEEKLFAQVVQRFQPQVQTLRLKEAIVDDDLVTQVHFGMTAVSTFTGHDRAAGKGGALADSSECERDLQAFLRCLDEAETKADAAAKGRDAKLKAPKG